MSHYTELKPKFLEKSEAELVSSLKSLFGENAVEVHDSLKELTGYDKNAGGKARRAHIIVRKENVRKAGGTCYNDLGYERDGNGMYKLWADPSDFPQTAQDKVAQDYAERVATKKLKSQGYTLKRTVEKNGVVKLVATKYS